MTDSATHIVPDDRHDRTTTAKTGRSRLVASLLTNPFWAIVALSGVGFVITSLVSVAATLGDPQGPMNRLINAYGTAAIVVETVTLIVAGLLAMTVDRVQTLRRDRAHRQSPSMTRDVQSHES